MTDREKVVKAMECCLHMLTDSGESHCHECPYNDPIMNHGCDNPVYCIKDYVRDTLRILRPRVLKPDEIDQFDVIYIEKRVEEDGEGEWHGWGVREMNDQEADQILFAVIGKTMRLLCDYSNYGIFWRCWSAQPTDEQMDCEPWPDPY